jgi:hypothetical protein
MERVAGRSNPLFRTGAILILSKQLEGAGAYNSSSPGSEYSRSTLSEFASRSGCSNLSISNKVGTLIVGCVRDAQHSHKARPLRNLLIAQLRCEFYQR